MPNPIASFLSHHSFRPTLWPTLGVIVLVAAAVALGDWQRHRAEDKQAQREQVDRASREPPLELVGAVDDVAALRFRAVRVVGEFDPRRQMLIDNKVHAGRAGYEVVTPLRLAEGRFILVDRGWVAQRATRAELPEAPPPKGEVVVEGRINLPPARYLELRPDLGGGPVRQNLDIERIAGATGLPLLPVLIEQTGDAHDGLVRDWPPPDFGFEQHRSYMLQWYSLALLGCVLWLGLNWRPRGGEDESSRS